jgi:2,5-furandicarboxylate decarboxylase 1
MKDLRHWLDTLRDEDLLAVIERPVDIDYTHAIACKNSGLATLFTNVTGYDIPLLVNSISTKRMMELALECRYEDIYEVYSNRIESARAPIRVQDSQCKQVISKGDEVDLTQLPIPLQHEFDGAPYISAAVQVARDPKTGALNLGIYRMMYRKEDEVSFDMTVRHHLWHYLHEQMDHNQPLEVACVLGLHPVDLLASVAQGPHKDIDTLGGFREEPCALVKCETIDVEVPSWAEIVIEGELLPEGWTSDEGPFGEVTGCYSQLNKNPIFKVKAITRRADCIFQSVTIGYNPGIRSTDTTTLSEPGAIWNAQSFLEKTLGVDVVSVRFLSMGIVLVAIRKKAEDEPARVIEGLLEHRVALKYVMVFDSDVNLFDDYQVFFALNFRTNPEMDVRFVGSKVVFPLDPSKHKAGGKKASKMGIDATIPLGIDKFPFLAPRPPFFEDAPSTDSRIAERRDNLQEADVTRIYQALLKRLEVVGSIGFSDILQEMKQENYRAILLAWGRLRAEGRIHREVDDGKTEQWKYLGVQSGDSNQQ